MSQEANIDVTPQELMEEYGMTPENAAKLLRDLPSICGELQKPQTPAAPPLPPTGGGLPGAGAPQYPYPMPMVARKDITEKISAEDLKLLESMTDDQIRNVFNYVDEILKPGDSMSRFGPFVRGLPSDNENLLAAILLEELFSVPTFLRKRNEQQTARAPDANRRSFLSRLQNLAQGYDAKAATDQATAYSPALVMNDELILTLDSEFTIEDGVLKTNAIATANMIQDYPEGKYLKDAEELKKAARFARQLPITNQHPANKVVTSQDEIMGWTTPVTFDEEKKVIKCGVEIFDSGLIEEVKAGKTDVSIGFMCDLDKTPGELDGVKYDAVQRNILLNHLACGLEKGTGRCPDGKCGLGLDAKEKAKAKEEEKKTDQECPGGDECKCGEHRDQPKKSDKKDGKGDKYPAPESAEEKARAKYNISTEAWEKMSEEERKAVIEKFKKEEAEEKEKDKGVPKTEAERCMAHFNISPEEWEKMSEEEKQKKMAELPPRGTGLIEEKKDEEAAPNHAALLKEASDVVKKIADSITRNPSKLKKQELDDLCSTLDNATWKLRDYAAVVRANGITVDAKVMDEALAAMEVPASVKEQLKDAAQNHAYHVDEVMDHNPPHDRAHYEQMTTDELKELVLLLDTTHPRPDITSDSSNRPNTVQDAYNKAVAKRLGKKR